MSLKHIKIRLKICWNVLFGKYKHYLLINVDKINLFKLMGFIVDFNHTLILK